MVTSSVGDLPGLLLIFLMFFRMDRMAGVPGQVGKDNTFSAGSGGRNQAEVHMGGEQDHQKSSSPSNIPQIR